MKTKAKCERVVQRIVILPAIILLGALLAGGSFPVQAQEPPTIKIGLLYPFTGPTAYSAKRALRGWELYLDSIGYKVGDRKVKMIVEDTKGDPNVCLTKTVKLIEQDQVHILSGIILSSEAYAIRDTVIKREVPLLITMANASELTREQRSPYIFRTMIEGGTPSHYIAGFVASDLKLKKAIVSALDYAYGREHAAMFKREFERLGGQVVFENFTPLGAADFSPYANKLSQMAGKAECLHFVYSGTDALRFIKAVQDFGLKKKFTLSSWGAMVDGPSLDQMGAAGEGIYCASIYQYSMKTEANRRFLELNRKAGGQIDALDYYGYMGAEVIATALKQIRGNVEDKAAFLKALREVKFECANGPFHFDPRSQNAVHTLNISRVTRVDGEFGKYQNVSIKSIPNAMDPWWIGK